MLSENEIESYISHLSPVLPSSLPSSDRSCSICLEPYSTPYNRHTHPLLDRLQTSVREYPIRVRSQHPNTQCKHVFGRRCIEEHFRSGGPWSTKCPMCKEQWFDYDSGEDGGGWEITAAAAVLANAEVVRMRVPQEITIRVGEHDAAHEEPEVTPMRYDATPGVINLRRSSAPRVTPSPNSNTFGTVASISTGSDENGPSAAEGGHQEQDCVGFSNRGRVHRSKALLERMLMTAEIDDRDAEMNARMVDVECAIERLWNRLEESGREWDDAVRMQNSQMGGPRRGAATESGDSSRLRGTRILYA